jgi:hypothetical protein
MRWTKAITSAVLTTAAIWLFIWYRLTALFLWVAVQALLSVLGIQQPGKATVLVAPELWAFVMSLMEVTILRLIYRQTIASSTLWLLSLNTLACLALAASQVQKYIYTHPVYD